MGPIAVVESRWWETGNHSVRTLFEAVAAIYYDNPSAFFYDMFADRSSLDTVFQSRAKDGATQVVYLASHGDENNIGPTLKNAISRAEFRNIIKSANTEANLKGLFLGTCMTGNANTVRFLIEDPDTKLDWVAGYRKPVDWIEGSAIDMVFMSKLASLYVANAKKKNGKDSARTMAHKAATHLIELIPGAHSKYGFNIYFHEDRKLTSMFHETNK